jgi:hypothetical protein
MVSYFRTFKEIEKFPLENNIEMAQWHAEPIYVYY